MSEKQFNEYKTSLSEVEIKRNVMKRMITIGSQLNRIEIELKKINDMIVELF